MTNQTRGMLTCPMREHPGLVPLEPQILQALELLLVTFRGAGKLLICGNGGSCADAGHIVGELMKSFRTRRPVAHGVMERLKEGWGAEGEKLAASLEGALPAISLCAHRRS